MSKPFRPTPTTPKPWKGWLPSRVVLGLLSAPVSAAEVAAAGLQAMETASQEATSSEAWSQAAAHLKPDPRPVLFSTMLDTATYLAIVSATSRHGLPLEQGISICFQEGLKQLAD